MLTERQSAVLRFVHQHQRSHAGVTPSMRDTADGLGLKSASTGLRVLQSLEERGCIRRLPERARAIELMPLGIYLLREAA